MRKIGELYPAIHRARELVTKVREDLGKSARLATPYIPRALGGIPLRRQLIACEGIKEVLLQEQVCFDLL